MTPLHPLARPAAAPGNPWTTIEETGKLVLPGMLQLLRVPENDQEDLAQKVLLAAFKSLPRYSPRGPKARGSAAPSECAVPRSTRGLSAICPTLASGHLSGAGSPRRRLRLPLARARQPPGRAGRVKGAQRLAERANP
jgi:hypothetical protein